MLSPWKIERTTSLAAGLLSWAFTAPSEPKKKRGTNACRISSAFLNGVPAFACPMTLLVLRVSLTLSERGGSFMVPLRDPIRNSHTEK